MIKDHFVLVLAMVVSIFFSGCDILTENPTDETPDSVFADAFKNHKSNMQVKKEATIISVLSDDTAGGKHQRCIVKLENQQTLLVAHNIDIAPRVPDLVKVTKLIFYGEYEWNAEGGVIHWTHKDPAKKHIDGWLEYKGKRYE